MNIIQTFWSCNNKDLLHESFGWAAPEYNLMSWALSSLLLKRQQGRLTLYADSNVTRMFIDQLRLPYDELHCELDKLNGYHPQLWALPKIYMYSVQQQPFVSVDGDAFLWSPIDPGLLQQDLIAQNKETDAAYYFAAREMVRENLSWLPDEVHKEILTGHPPESYNAGIFGGNDLAFFKEYTEKAFAFVDNNINDLGKIEVSCFNTIFEQYLFYCLAKQQGKKVSLFLPDAVSDLTYKGFADFSDVPHKKQYLHLHGKYKKSRAICDQLAGRLRHEFPEYYDRIIGLFRSNGKSLMRDDHPAGTFPFISRRVHRTEAFLTAVPPGAFPDDLVEGLKEDAARLDEWLAAILAEKFAAIDRSEIDRLDSRNIGLHEILYKNDPMAAGSYLIRCPWCECIDTEFDWTFLDNTELPVETAFRQITASGGQDNKAIVVPECHGEGYSYYNGDEMDWLILEELQQPLTLTGLLGRVAQAFDPDELKEGLDDLRKLIDARVTRAITNKIVTLAPQ